MHTKGQWSMNMYYKTDKRRHLGVFTESKQVAHLAEPSFQEPDWATEQEDNARLISAAPDLLEACKGRAFNFIALLTRLAPGHVINKIEADLISDQVEVMVNAISRAEKRD